MNMGHYVQNYRGFASSLIFHPKMGTLQRTKTSYLGERNHIDSKVALGGNMFVFQDSLFSKSLSSIFPTKYVIPQKLKA